MKYKIPGYGWLSVTPSEQKKITSETGQSSFLKRHFSDILKESSSLKEMVSKMTDLKIIADAMAGCGFSASILKSVFPDCKLILNDWDKHCYENLKLNFPDSVLSNEDIKEWELNEEVDLLFIDFNNFTLKRIEDWKPTILRLNEKCKNLIITDSACYGFRWGNLKSYKVETPIQYYELLEKELGLDNKYFTRFSMFGSAALLLFQSKPSQVKQIKWKSLNLQAKSDKIKDL